MSIAAARERWTAAKTAAERTAAKDDLRRAFHDTASAFKRAHVDPARVARELGLEKGAIKGRNGAVTVCCPWHSERTASCSISVAEDRTIRVHCFGCDASGDVVHLYAQVHGVSVAELLEGARPLAPHALEALPPPAPAPAVSDDVFDDIASIVLALSPLTGDVAAYLDRRGVLEEALRAGCGALPSDHRAIVAAVVEKHGRESWLASGLAWKDGERFVWPGHRLVIPYRAPGVDGTIVTLQRRRLEDSRADLPKYVFPSGRTSPRWPFGGDDIELADDDTAIVFCEGAIDALTLRRCYRADGLNRIVLSIPSVSTWIPAWARLAAGRLAIIATDADKAGDKVAATMADDLFAAGALAVQRAKPATSAKDWTAQEAHA